MIISKEGRRTALTDVTDDALQVVLGNLDAPSIGSVLATSKAMIKMDLGEEAGNTYNAGRREAGLKQVVRYMRRQAWSSKLAMREAQMAPPDYRIIIGTNGCFNAFLAIGSVNHSLRQRANIKFHYR